MEAELTAFFVCTEVAAGAVLQDANLSLFQNEVGFLAKFSMILVNNSNCALARKSSVGKGPLQTVPTDDLLRANGQ